MSEADVTAILGEPLQKRPGSNAGGVLLDYAIDGVALRSFAFWIALDHDGRVDTIHVEEYPLWADSYAIYERRPGLPVYEHPDFRQVIERQK